MGTCGHVRRSPAVAAHRHTGVFRSRCTSSDVTLTRRRVFALPQYYGEHTLRQDITRTHSISALNLLLHLPGLPRADVLPSLSIAFAPMMRAIFAVCCASFEDQ